MFELIVFFACNASEPVCVCLCFGFVFVLFFENFKQNYQDDVRMEEDGDDIHKKLTDLRINAVEEAVQVSRGTVQKTMVPNAAVKDRKSIQAA